MVPHLRLLAILFGWVLSVGAAWAWSATGAQRSAPDATPRLLYAEDVGFRVDRLVPGGPVVGSLMVRVNGEWREAELAAKLRLHPAR